MEEKRKQKTKSRGNGEGTIYYSDSKQCWVGQYVAGTKADGKIDRPTVYGKTRKEVKEKIEDLITDLKTNKYVKKSNILFKTIAKQFIDDGYKFNKLKDASYKRKLDTYKQVCSHYMANMEIQKITEKDVKDFLFYITKYSNSVIGKIYGLVNNTFKRAVRKNIIRFNFLEDKLEFGKPISNRKDKKVRGFTIEEQRQFINVVTDTNNKFKYKYQMLLSMVTGMRMGEINALDKDKDIDFKHKIIHVRRTLTKDKNDKTIMGSYTKTVNGERDIIMDSQAEFLLREYIENYFVPNEENLLFYNVKDNKYITTSQVNMVFKRLCQKHNIALGYEVNQHMLRHTFATRCIEAGMPANVLSKILGHADIRTTLEVYCDVFANYEKQHSNRTYDYLKANSLLLNQTTDNIFPQEELDKIVNNLKIMYQNQDDRLIKLLKLVA